MVETRLLAVPNVSEGKDPSRIRALAAAAGSAHSRVLDVHSDPVHHRSVFTIAGSMHALATDMGRLAALACSLIDLENHEGAHPRLGALDVCPIVPLAGATMEQTVEAALETAHAIAEHAGLPVYLYGESATRAEARELPALRRGGLGTLVERAGEGFKPDFGPEVIDMHRGVVCVGARDVLVAFNVWLRADVSVAKEIASVTRTSGGGPPGVRALGLRIDPSTSQVSMNLVDPARSGVDVVFERVAAETAVRHANVIATEIVGLVPERFMPDPEKKAARLLKEPGRSLESVLEG